MQQEPGHSASFKVTAMVREAAMWVIRARREGGRGRGAVAREAGSNVGDACAIQGGRRSGRVCAYTLAPGAQQCTGLIVLCVTCLDRT